MRVAVQNVWGRYGEWPERREVLRDGLRNAAPDLVAFVEPVKTEHYDQIEDLLGPGYEIVYQSKRERERVGTALASRWPIQAVHELDLARERAHGRTRSTSPWRPRSSRRRRSARCSSWPPTRSGKWATSASASCRRSSPRASRSDYASEHDTHVILAGDFDAVPEAASIRFLTGRQSWTA